MNADKYQELSKRTYNEDQRGLTPFEALLLNGTSGLAGEAGEVADYIKKCVYHGVELDRDKLVEELGDLMWYISALCTTLGLTLSEVLTANVLKLEERYPDGFRKIGEWKTVSETK